jgi:glycerol-3-phosphate dehydrogenase
MESTQVVIIGGGATGAGILWDLSLRGISAVLLEQKDIANGATGRCHGLLHSGGRYIVKDPEAARECIAENRIVKAIAPHCVEETGGLFVQCPGDDAQFYEQWWRAAHQAGLQTQRLSAQDALALEPNLQPDILGAFTCLDAHVDVFRLVQANLEAAIARGGRVLTYCEVNGLRMEKNRVRAVRYRHRKTGEEGEIACELVINAAGGWAQHVARLAGLDLPVRCDMGTLLVLNHRHSHRVINRCRKPGDGDILVPAGPVSILGTTSMQVPSPENLSASPEEIDELLQLGGKLVRGMEAARITRVFSGVRPLYAPPSDGGAAGRSLSRGFVLLDHGAQEGVGGFLSIIGGKLTTYRLMAAAASDRAAVTLGLHTECKTALTPLRPAGAQNGASPAAELLPRPALERLQCRLGSQTERVLSAIAAQPELAEMVCECELVSRAELDYVLAATAPLPARTIADIGRRTRLGFGPCQGTFCGHKAMLAGYQAHRWSAAEAAAEFKDYLAGRWKGQLPIHRGMQVEQLEMGREIYRVEAPEGVLADGADGK